MTFTPRYTSDGRQYYDERTSEHPYSFIDVTDASLGFDFKGEFKNASEGENSSFEFGAGKTITIKVNPENKERPRSSRRAKRPSRAEERASHTPSM